MTASVTVGPNELWDAYVREKESIILKYARYSPVYFSQKLNPTDQEMIAWIEANQTDVDAEYERQKHRYTGLEKQVSLLRASVKRSSINRHIQRTDWPSRRSSRPPD